MPVPYSCVFDVIMYEYAKLIADRAIERRTAFAPAERKTKEYWWFVNATFRKIKNGKISPSSILRENKQLVDVGECCAYCGAVGPLQWEHVIPRSRGGPDTIDNLVLACADCNREKANRNPIEWYDSKKLHRKEVPRLVMGKLLKLVLEEHRQRGTLYAGEYPAGKALGLYTVCLVFDQSHKESPKPIVDT